ncbi:MAG: hypothetical protein LBK52_07095 [Deltaproteobacteria bacterium]|jgi:ADP-heptose:LPS heptosyltransferase|nr:hypothetical protein [Deltaproteobacteria bacterium]
MKALIAAPFKLGDFIQLTPVLEGLQEAYEELYLWCTQPAVAEAARLRGQFAGIIEAGANDERLPEKLPLDKISAVCNYSSGRPAVVLLDWIRTHYPKIRLLGPQLKGDRIALPRPQALAKDLMTISRRLSPFNLVDIWRRADPDLNPGRRLSWPRPAGTRPEAAALRASPADSPTAAPVPAASADSAASSLNSPTAAGSAKPEASGSRTPASQSASLGRPPDRIGLVPGAGSSRRRWPKENFLALAEAVLAVPDTEIVLLGSRPERTLGRALTEGLEQNPRVINLMGETNLKQLGDITAGLKVLVSGDTGVMHLGAALGTPLVSLFFGPAAARETGPYGEGHQIVQAWAPCAPCAESSPCQWRTCRDIPEAGLAAGLVLKALHKTPAGLEAPLPEGREIYTAVLDDFGWQLKLQAAEANFEQWTASLVLEAARAAVEPLYNPRKPALPPSEKKPAAMKSLLQSLESGLHLEPARKTRFLAVFNDLAASF